MLLQRSVPCLAIGLALAGCSSNSAGLPEGRPLTPEEIAYERSLLNTSVVARTDGERGQLIRQLDQALMNWHQSQAEVLGSRERELVQNYEEILQTKTYMNLDNLLTILAEGDDTQKAIAAGALGFVRLKEPVGEDAREAFLDRWPQRYKEVVHPLTAATASEDAYIVENAAMALGQIGDKDTPLPPLLALLERKEEEIRSNAALALARVLTPETGSVAIDALLVATNDPAAKVRLHAVSAIRATKHPAGIGSVARLLNDNYELIAMNAAETLGLIGNEQSCGYLIARLKKVLGQTPSGDYRPVSDLDHRRRRLTDHLIGALERLSGEDFDDDIEDWEEWWREAEGAS